MLNRRKTEISVGLFILMGLLALLILALRVSHFGGFNQPQHYTLNAYFENIGGLHVKAPITISGVKIGEVSAIHYDAKRYQALVIMEIEARYNFLSTDTQASIYTAGLLGAQYLALSPGAEDSILKAGDTIQHTQSALVLEEMIGQFLVNMATK
jgi:phospholipid/cholesterol/gamma-HCH transport system substrate-binding protein